MRTDGLLCYTIVMSKLLERAIEKAAMLPDAAQEKIGEELLLHVDKVNRLRAALEKGVRSLDHGDGRELDIDDVIKRARMQYDKA
jgi:hypothetical protein